MHKCKTYDKMIDSAALDRLTLNVTLNMTCIKFISLMCQ